MEESLHLRPPAPVQLSDCCFLLLSRCKDSRGTIHPSSLLHEDTARQYFLKKLMQQIQESPVFEGPDGSKNLSLNSKGTTPNHPAENPFTSSQFLWICLKWEKNSLTFASIGKTVPFLSCFMFFQINWLLLFLFICFLNFLICLSRR